MDFQTVLTLIQKSSVSSQEYLNYKGLHGYGARNLLLFGIFIDCSEPRYLHDVKVLPNSSLTTECLKIY